MLARVTLTNPKNTNLHPYADLNPNPNPKNKTLILIVQWHPNPYNKRNPTVTLQTSHEVSD